MSVPSFATPNPQPAGVDGGAKRFGAAPVWAFVVAVVTAVGGATTHVLTRNATVVAMCGGDRMRPGDLCETRRRGVVTTRTYGQVLADAERLNLVAQWIGLALVVVGVALGVLVFVRWRQDVAARAQLRDDHGRPLGSHSRTVSTSLLGVLFGSAVVGGAIYCALAGITSGVWVWFLGTAIAGALGIGMLVLAVPKNGVLVQTFDGGVRVVSRGRVVDLPWRDVAGTIVPGRGTATHTITGPGLPAVTLTGLSDHERLQQFVQQRTVQTKVGPALAAIDRGEAVDFGHLAVSREGIRQGAKLLPWQEYGGIALHQGQVTVSRVPQGRFTTTSLGKVRDYAVLLHVIDAVLRRQPHAAPSS